MDSQDFRLEQFQFEDLRDDELLVEPLFGSWEGNMSHSVARRPIDICRRRREPRVVIGNASVLRVLRAGSAVRGVAEGAVGILYSGYGIDEFGYTVSAHGYDAPGTIGMLAKRSKIPARNFLPLPVGSTVALERWAAFAVRYLTAWSNWKLAFGAYRLQMSAADDPAPFVLGWGGGSTYAELDLARRHGCRVAMISGSEERLAWLAQRDIHGIDRRAFPDLETDESRMADPAFKRAQQASERAFLATVKAWTGGAGAAVMVDYIGGPVFRASLRALGRQGVLTTAGWLLGMQTPINRAIECIARHIHVHTHFIRHGDCAEAMEYAVANEWLPEVSEIYDWDEVPRLARNAAAGQLQTYFPVYRVNPV
ncbi:MAG TPA: zinc-binding dehydrogenase [Nannocystis sp.]